MKKAIVIIPAFNEASCISSVIKSVCAEAPGVDIVVVDDGSNDSTVEIARGEGVKVLCQKFNLGIGATMQTGYMYAHENGYDIAVQFDGDGQHPADQIAELIEPVADGSADVVVGSRFLGRGDYKPSKSRGAGIAIFSKVVSAIIREKVTDTTSGFRAVNREVIDFYCKNYPDDYPEVEALILLHKKGFRIVEIPVTMVARMGGSSSITPMRSAYYMVKVMLAIFVELLRRVEK
ncbi:MAG: glycosyltransferase family 2 protein [Proteobacteria bacterium]|nr:glycosyltransferase family 2 protein [Pseudomonadota bacterium]